MGATGVGDSFAGFAGALLLLVRETDPVDVGVGNSTDPGLPAVPLRFASFFRFSSISISASQETFTGGGWTHSLKLF